MERKNINEQIVRLAAELINELAKATLRTATCYEMLEV